MTWALVGKRYLAHPYSCEPGVHGWSVWLATAQSLTRIGRDIKTLRAAQALAQLHAKGEKRVRA